jgi:hypothetical protein
MDTQSRTWKRESLMRTFRRVSDRRSVKPSASLADTWLSRTKIFLEIVAIPVVAYWAFTRFNAQEAPALEHRAKIQGELSWQRRSDKECIAEYRIKFENIGMSSIELTKAKLRAWPLDVSVLSAPIAYVDPLKMRDKKPIVEADLEEYLVHRYPPSVTDEVGLMFVVKRAPGDMLVFLVEGESQIDRRGSRQSWFDHRWDYVCGESGTASPSK